MDGVVSSSTSGAESATRESDEPELESPERDPMDPDRIVAVVPARGGSKSIPRKNLERLGGHPLVGWAVAAGRQAERVGRTLVSTDDSEIRDVALGYGAEAPFLRPVELADDDTPDLPVFRHLLGWLEREEGVRPEILVQLRPTSPLRPPGLVDRAVAALEAEPEASAVRTVAAAGQNPYKMWRVREDRLVPLMDRETVARELPDIHPGTGSSGTGGGPDADEPARLDPGEPFNLPRQALPDSYWQTGQVDATRRRTVLEEGSMTGSRLLPLEVEPRLGVDIDRPEDLERARWLLSRYEGPLVRPGDLWELGSVQAVVLDFDGVLTDNRVYLTQEGRESVACDRRDGMGISALREGGIGVAVLSTEVNPVVEARCRKLEIPCRHGLEEKAAALQELAGELDVELDRTVFVGNDINDLECMRAAGLGVAVADAVPEVLSEADWVLSRPGGRGAVRELCDQILQAKA